MRNAILQTLVAASRTAKSGVPWLGVFWLCLFAGLPAEGKTRVRVDSAVQDRVILVCETNGYRLDTRVVDGTVYSVVREPGLPLLKEPGFPELPWAQARVILADGSTPVLTVRAVEVTEAQCPPPLPSRGFFSRSDAPPPLLFDPFYQGQGIWPIDACSLGVPFNVRDLRAVSVNFHPFQYDAGKGVLRILKRIEVEVVGAVATPPPGKGGTSQAWQHHRRAGTEALGMFRAAAINPERLSGALRSAATARGAATTGATTGAADASRAASLPAEDSRLLVIVPDGWESTVAAFATWKRQRGMQVEVARYPTDTNGSGTGALATFIQARYAAVSTDFVLLVGDAPEIPCQTSSAGVPSDTLYTLMDAQDTYHDLFLSRVSAPTAAEAAKQLARFVLYEKTPAMPRGTAWYQEGACVASELDSGSDPAYGADKVELQKEKDKWLANGFTAVDALFAPGVATAQITTAVNAGRSLVFYLGHGSATSWTTGNFTTTTAAQLTNGTMLPFVVSGGCNTGEFTSGADCLAEAWMKAGATADSAGAIGFVGATTAMAWDPPTVMEHGISDLLFGGQVRTLGGLTFGGVQKAMDYCYGASSNYGASEAIKIMQQTHLFGDASLQLRFRSPAALTVTGDTETVPQVPFLVNVKQTDGAQAAVEGATVCLYRDDGIQGVAVTDAAGNAAVIVDGMPGSDLTLTVFHRDYVTNQKTVPLAAGALRIVSASALADAFVGANYAATPRVVGGAAPYTWEVATPATFPGSWLTLAADTGQLSGVPVAPGAHVFTLRVTDSVHATAEREFTLTSGAAVGWVTTELPAGTVDAAYDTSFELSGSFPPFTVERISGSLPVGISLSSSGTLRGVPTVAGTYSFGVRATDAKARTAERVFSVEIQAAATITITTAAAFPDADRGQLYSQTLSAHGGTGNGFAWALLGGALPSGLTMDRTGVIAGTPAVAGAFTFRAAVEDNAVPPHHAEQGFTLTVKSPVYFTSAALPRAGVGVAYDVPVPVAGSYTPFTFTAKGTSAYGRTDSAQPAFAVTGAKQSWTGEYDSNWSVDLGFSFPFFGTAYTTIKVGYAGVLILGANSRPSPEWEATSTAFAGKVMIAPFWNDLVISSRYADTGIWVAQNADDVTVCWRGREYDHNDWILEFSATLYRDGRIQFRYGQVQTTNRVVIGISNGTGSSLLVVAHTKNQAGVSSTEWNNHQTLSLTPFQPLPAWLTLTSAGRLTGTPPQTGSHEFTVEVVDSRSNWALQNFTVDVVASDAFALTLQPGWNCVSLPVVPLNPDPAALWPAGSVSYGWNAQRQVYEQPLEIVAKAGYWVFNPAAVDVILTIHGTAVADPLVSLESPWNLVGPLGTVDLTDCATINLPAWEWYDGHYRTATSMRPGLGYLLRAGIRGSLDVRGVR